MPNWVAQSMGVNRVFKKLGCLAQPLNMEGVSDPGNMPLSHVLR